MKKMFAMLLYDDSVDVFMWKHFKSAEIFIHLKNSLILYFLYFLIVTDHNVQQYGEVNQLGGVFVNVNFT